MAIGSRKHRTHRVHGKKGLDTGNVRNEINVTPLVDVCLVLLIIFMVILPMMTRGKDVPLPQTRHHNEDKDRQQPIISLVQDAETGALTYFLDQEEVKVGPVNDPSRFKTLQNKVQEAQEAANADAKNRQDKNPKAGVELPGQRVYLKAGQDLTYEKVFPVILALREIDAKIQIGTNEIREK